MIFYTKINFCFNLIASADVITAIALHLVVKKHVHRYYETLIQNKIEKSILNHKGISLILFVSKSSLYIKTQ